MKHLVITLTFLLLGFVVPAQEGQPPTAAAQIFPTSPEAASLGKYGEIPVNLSTGRINYTVPIYTITVGDYSYPIALSYNYAGLMAEEDAGLVGLGWNLTAAGMITRRVFGKPDESPLGYIGQNMGDDHGIGQKFVGPYQRGLLSPSDELSLFKYSASGFWDTEPDKFIINTNDSQGNFYFNEDATPIFVPHKNYIVNFENNFQGKITVVNDKGVIYEFGIKENTTHENLSSDGAPLSYVSSWYLEKIRFPNTTQEITFEYEPYTYTKASFSESQSFLRGDCASYEIDGMINRSNTSQSETTIQAMVLKKIQFPSGSVVFNTTVKNESSVGHGGAVLNTIDIKDRFNKNIDSYRFAYSNEDPEKKKVLTSITKVNNNSSLPYYRFEYYGTIPDNIRYTSQDVWGFYNGKRNAKLISGDRSTSFDHAVLGALKKIHYPTQGFTEIAYEQNRTEYTNIPLSPNCIDLMTNEVFEFRANSREDGNIEGTKTISIKTPQTIKVTLSASTGGQYGTANSSVGITYDEKSPCDPVGKSSISSYKEGSFIHEVHEPVVSYLKVNPGDVTISYGVLVEGNFTTGGMIATCSIKVEYYDRDKSPDHSIPVGGIRVKSTKDYSSPNEHTSKEYTYLKEDGTTSGILLNRPIYSINQAHSGCGNCLVKTTMASSNIPLASFQGSPVLYKRVTTLQNGTTDNGKKVQYFTGGKNLPNRNPFAYRNPKDWQKGLLEKEEVFEVKNNTLVKVQQTKLDYQYIYPYTLQEARTTHKLASAFKSSRVKYAYGGADGGMCALQPAYGIQDFISDEPFYLPEFYQNVKVEQSDFYGGIEVKTTTTYDYDQLRGYLKKKVFSNSTNEHLVNTYTYPFDENNTVLLSKNMVSIPTASSIYEDINKNNSIDTNEQLSAQKTVFKNGPSNLVLPELSQIAKGAHLLETRLIYHQYDAQGNPLEVSQPDGRHMIYVWGYNDTQPIVKIDNTSYTGIPATATAIITQLQTVSNTEDTASKEVTMRNLFKDLREHSYFADAQVTGYTYDPLVGVTSMTDPEGYTTYYQYDEMNRLQYTLDHEQYVAQQLRYNYQGEQTANLGDVTISPNLSAIQPNQAVTFTTNTSGSGGADLYTWSVDGVQEQCDSTTSFTKTFASEGTYTVSVLAYNTQTKHRVSKTMTVVVAYPPITIPVLSANYTHIITGTTINFSASGIGGGTGDLRYEWYVNNTKQASTATTFTYTTNTAGTYTVYFKVIDNTSGKSTDSEVRLLHVYNPLNTPAVSTSKTYIVKGTTINFSTSGIGGGSGSRSYEWYVNNVKQNATGTSYSKSFPGTGTYTVKFRVIDNTISEHYKEKSVTVHSYNPMQVTITSVGGGISSHDDTVTLTVNPPTGGSGHFSRSNWKRRRMTPPLSEYTLSHNDPTFIFTGGMNGEYELSMVITDTRTGQKVTVRETIMVDVPSGGGDGGDGPGQQH